MKKKVVVFVIPDGVGIRNYLYSDILRQLLEKNARVLIWHSISDNAINEILKVYPQLKNNFHKLPLYKEPRIQYFLRELICFLRLNYNFSITKNETILSNWKPQKSTLKKLFYKTIEAVAWLTPNKYSSILRVEKYYQRLLRKSNYLHYESFLKDQKVEVLFCTHQRAVQAIPAVEAAKKANVKTIGAIFSWDNLPKARLTNRTEFYVVWSNYMKEEMATYYQEIDLGKVFITGTPQFEFYYNEKLFEDRASFCNKYRLDSSKKIICFSGDDTRTSPHDPNYLKDLAEQIQMMPNANEYQILFRRCPVDFSGRYDAIVEKYANLIKEVAPIWNVDKTEKGNWMSVYPTYSDVKLLINTIRHSDCVINIGSTMALDFAMFSKPAIYLNYDTVNDSTWSVTRIYKFQHFRSMGSLKPIYWLNSKNEIAQILNQIEQKNDNVISDSKAWLEKITYSKRTASNNIVNIILN